MHSDPVQNYFSASDFFFKRNEFCHFFLQTKLYANTDSKILIRIYLQMIRTYNQKLDHWNLVDEKTSRVIYLSSHVCSPISSNCRGL